MTWRSVVRIHPRLLMDEVEMVSALRCAMEALDLASVLLDMASRLVCIAGALAVGKTVENPDERSQPH